MQSHYRLVLFIMCNGVQSHFRLVFFMSGILALDCMDYFAKSHTDQYTKVQKTFALFFLYDLSLHFVWSYTYGEQRCAIHSH